MADVNISELPPITSATDDDVIIINDGDINTRKITWSNLVNSISDFTSPTSFSAGTESAPSITFTGDLNTGIYRPASTDKLGFVTNGTTRLYIDETGRVSIGNTSPESYSPISNDLVIGNASSGDNGVTIVTGSDDVGSIVFADGTDSSSETAGRLVYDHADDHLHFETDSEERLRITEDGFVGVGTSDPQQLLHVSSGDSGVSSLVPGVFGTIIESISTQNAGLIFQTASNRTAGFYFSDPENTQAGSIVFSNSSDLMSFSINSTERLGIGGSGVVFSDSSGNQVAIVTDDGRLRVGPGTPTSGLLSITGNITGSADQVAVEISGAVQSDVTGSAVSYLGTANTQAASFTLPNAYHFKSQGGTLGAGSVITNQYGFHVSSLGNATNNYGFYSDISTTGDFQYYASGSAPNYFNGSTHTFANGGVNVLQITGGTSNFLTDVTFPNITVDGTITAVTGSFTQVNSTNIGYTGALTGPAATITTIGGTTATYTSFVGDLTGNVTGNSDTATQVAVTPTNSTNLNYQVAFTDSSGVDRPVRVDSDLTYNPSSNTLNSVNVSSTNGNITNVISTDVTTTDLTVTGNLTVPGDITGNISGDSMVVNDLVVNDDLIVTDTSTFNGPVSFTSTVNGTFTGSLTGNADSATAVSTGGTSSSSDHFVTFVAASSGNQTLLTDAGIKYNPSLNRIYVDIEGTVIGGVTGSVETANKINLIETEDANATHYILFADSTTGSREVRSDSSLTYNPSLDTLTIGAIIGNGSGLTSLNASNISSGTISDDRLPAQYSGNAATATLATNATNANSATNSTNSNKINISTNETVDSTHYVTFSSGSSGNQTLNSDSGLTYNPSTNTVTATTFSGNATSADTSISSTNATNINPVPNNSTDSSHFITFTGSASGNQVPNSDSGLTYNPSNNTLTTGKVSSTFIGNGSGLTSLNASNISSGTISDDRLPSTISSDITGSSASCTGNSATATLATTATRADDSDRVNVSAVSDDSNYRVVFTEANNNNDTSGNIYKDSQTNFYYNPSTNTLTAGIVSGSHSGNGSLLTQLNASNISSGTISDDRLPAIISSDITGNAVTLDNLQSNQFLRSDQSDTMSGNLTVTGNVNSSSDSRLKKNIEVIENPIEKIQNLSGYTYDRTDINIHQLGVIAQEVEQVIPEAVSEDDNGMKSVSYNQLIPLLIEAIKEQQKEIDELKSKLG